MRPFIAVDPCYPTTLINENYTGPLPPRRSLQIDLGRVQTSVEIHYRSHQFLLPAEAEAEDQADNEYSEISVIGYGDCHRKWFSMDSLKAPLCDIDDV